MNRSDRFAFRQLEGLLNGGTNLINASGLFDATAQHPEIVRWRLGMHCNSHQDRNSGKHIGEIFADLFQKELPSVVYLATAKVDPESLKVRARVPKNLDDVGGQSGYLARSLKRINA